MLDKYRCPHCCKHYEDHNNRACDMLYVHDDWKLEYRWVTYNEYYNNIELYVWAARSPQSVELPAFVYYMQ